MIVGINYQRMHYSAKCGTEIQRLESAVKDNETIIDEVDAILIVDTLTFDIYNPDIGYETHSLTYVPANELTLGKDVIYFDGDNTMPYVRE